MCAASGLPLSSTKSGFARSSTRSQLLHPSDVTDDENGPLWPVYVSKIAERARVRFWRKIAFNRAAHDDYRNRTLEGSHVAQESVSPCSRRRLGSHRNCSAAELRSCPGALGTRREQSRLIVHGSVGACSGVGGHRHRRLDVHVR